MSRPQDYIGDYEGDIGEGYPLPPASQRTTNLTGTILKTAAIFIASPFVNKAVEGALGRVGGGLATGLIKLAGRSPLVSRVVGGITPSMPKTLGGLLGRNSVVKSIGTKYNRYLENMGIDTAQYTTWKGIASRQKNTPRATGGLTAKYTNKGVNEKVNWGTRQWQASGASQRSANLRSFFADRSSNYQAYRGRLWGGVEGFFKEYGKQLPGSFISDKLINIVTGDRPSNRNTAWWNLPGHISNFAGDMAKASVSYLPFYAGFKGLTGAARMASDGMERSLRFSMVHMKTARGTAGRNTNTSSTFASDVLYQAALGTQNLLRKVDNRSQRISNAYDTYKNSVRGRDEKGNLSFMALVKSGAKAAAEGYRKSIDKDRVSLVYFKSQMNKDAISYLTGNTPNMVTPPGQLIREMIKLRGAEFPMGEDGGSEYMKSLYEKSGRPKRGFLGSIGGIVPLRYDKDVVTNLTDTTIHNINSSDSSVANSITGYVSGDRGRSSRYYGHGIYDLGAGRVLDVSALRPKNIISSAIDKLHNTMNFHYNPLNEKTINPIEILGLKAMKDWLLGISPDVKVFNTGDSIRLGTLTKNEISSINMTNLRNSSKDAFNKFGATFKVPEDTKVVWTRENEHGQGKFHFYNTTAKDKTFVTLNSLYRLSNTPLGGRIRGYLDILYNLRGGDDDDYLNTYNSANNEELIDNISREQGKPRWLAWWDTITRNPSTKIYDNFVKANGKKPFPGLEVGAGYGGDSVLGVIGNFFSKFTRNDSPLKYLSTQEGPLAKIKPSTIGDIDYINADNYDEMRKYLTPVRGVLYDSIDEAWNIFKRNDTYKKFKDVQIVTGGDGKSSVTFGDVWGNTKSSKANLINTVKSIIGEAESTHLPSSIGKVKVALENLEEHPEYWSHITTHSRGGRQLSVGDELHKFLFRTHITNMVRDNTDQNYLQDLLSGGTDDIYRGLSGKEKILVKSVDTLSHFENLLGSRNLAKMDTNVKAAEYLLTPEGEEDAATMNKTLSMLMSRHRDGTLEGLSRIIQPPWSTNLPNKNMSDSMSHSTNTSVEAIQINKWLPFEENINKFGILGGIGRTLFPRYHVKNPETGIMGPRISGVEDDPADGYSDYIATPTRFLTSSAMRLNNLASKFGMGLNLRERTTWEQMGKGMLTNIYLPALGLYAGYKSIDTLFDTNPAFAGSLKYEELVLVRHRVTGIIKYIKIGELVDNLDAREYDAWTNNNGSICFKKIMAGIRHKRETPLVRLELSNYSDILVTTNHSLFTGPEDNLQITQPLIGNSITQCSKVPPREVIYNNIDILDYIEDENSKVYVVVRDKRLDSKWKYNSKYQFTKDYHTWLVNNVVYDGRKYRTNITGAKSCPKEYRDMIRLAFNNSDIELPIRYKLDYNLGYLIGIFISEGSSIFTHKGVSYSPCRISISAEENYDGYKGNIRDRIIKSMLSVFPDCHISINRQSINLNSYLYYKFFREVLDCGGKAPYKRIPDIIMNGSDDCIYGLLDGYFDGDGTYNALGNGTFKFTTISRELVCQLTLLLKQLGANVYTYNEINTGDAYIGNRRINSKYRKYKVVARGITISGFVSNKSYKSNSVRRLGNTSVVKSMELVEQDEYVYDLSVEDAEKFVAGTGMIYAHNTSLDEGISVALAEEYAKADMRAARLNDLLGVTKFSKWSEGLMPGSMTSPLSRLTTAFAPTIAGATIGTSVGGPTGGLIGASAGLGASLMLGMGIRDTTKSREELEDIYSGRELVPVRKGRFWSMGKTPYEGSRISYWRVGWFARMKSQYQYTPSMYGSKMEEFFFRNPLMKPAAMLIDPYHWERKSYFTAPTPQTGPAFEEVPFIGPLLSGTIGKVVKPIKTMHGDELRASFSGPAYQGTAEGVGSGFFPPAGIGGNIDSPFKPGSMEVRHPAPMSQHSLSQTLSRTLYRSFTEPGGLTGYATQELLGGIPGESETVMENSNYRTSMTRAYWDLQLGDLLAATEYPRRFMPRNLAYTSQEAFNPLSNAYPDWLSGGSSNTYFKDFRTGNPNIPERELRLPGFANMAAYRTRLTMPFRASQLGKNRQEMIQYMTGTRPPATAYEEDVMEEGTAMHKIVQEELARSNMLVKAEAAVYDPYSDISGTVDAIVRQGRQSLALELKTVSTEKLERLTGPVSYHRSQLNFYLKQLRLRQGKIIYMSREDPTLTKTFNVTYNHGLYLNNVAALQEARAAARDILGQGLGNPGEAYSHLDRLRVLADVEPYSDSYKKELSIVNQQDKAGILSPEEHDEKMKILKRRNATARNYDLYPRRFNFKGIIAPDSETQLLNENENIKAAAEYSLPERIGGGLWEYLTHQRSPVHSKLIGRYSPREQYERFVIAGSESAFWNAPYKDFIEPYMRGAASTTRPDEGIIRGMQAGFLLGGPAGSLLGGGALGIYGALHGAFRAVTGTTYVPGNVKRKWEVSEYFDKLEYLKAQRLYNITGMQDYARQMGETMTGINPMRLGRGSMTDVARAVPNSIKPYIFAFMAETDPQERKRIAGEVPENVAQVLRVKWELADKDSKGAQEVYNTMQDSQDLTGYYKDHYLPPEDNLAWSPRIPLEDIQVKTVEHMGYNAHDWGIGYYSQQRRIKNSPFLPPPINMSNPTGESLNPEASIDKMEVQAAIRSILSQYGVTSSNISIMATPGTGSRITVNLNVDQVGAISRQLGV